MREHIHTDVVQITTMAVGVAIAFHVFRWVGAKMADNQQLAGVGNALGGAFTFR